MKMLGSFFLYYFVALYRLLATYFFKITTYKWDYLIYFLKEKKKL